MKVATVYGYHGMGNLGDDFFLRYLLQKLKNKGYSKVYVTAPRGKVANTLVPEGIKLVPIVTSATSYLRGYDKWLMFFFCALRSRTVFFCAGSIFTILPTRVFYASIKGLRLLRKSVGIHAIGVSVGPFRTQRDRRLTCAALSLFDSIVVRDEKSLGYLAGIKNVRFIKDLAFDSTIPAHLGKRHGCVGICLNPYRSVVSSEGECAERRRNCVIAKRLRMAYSRGLLSEVKVFVTCSSSKYGDLDLAVDMHHKLAVLGITSTLVEYIGNIEPFISELSQCEKVISSRLHAGFFALLSGSEVLQLSYAEKIFEFYKGVEVQSLSVVDAYDLDQEGIDHFLLRPYRPIVVEASLRALWDIREHVRQQFSVVFEGDIR